MWCVKSIGLCEFRRLACLSRSQTSSKTSEMGTLYTWSCNRLLDACTSHLIVNTKIVTMPMHLLRYYIGELLSRLNFMPPTDFNSKFKNSNHPDTIVSNFDSIASNLRRLGIKFNAESARKIFKREYDYPGISPLLHSVVMCYIGPLLP